MGKAEFQVLGLVQPITGQGGQVDIVVGFLTVLGIEAIGLQVLIAGSGRGGVVTPDIPGIHIDLLEANTQQGQPLRRWPRLPFAVKRYPVAPAVVDVPKGAGIHVGPGG